MKLTHRKLVTLVAAAYLCSSLGLNNIVHGYVATRALIQSKREFIAPEYTLLN